MTLYADVIAALFAVSLFLLFFYGPWQAILVDYARQIAFEQRDKVFDLAAAGKLDFESRDYQVIREAFNNLIRFAHELNWMRLLMHGQGSSRDARSDFQLTIEKIEDPELRATVSSYVRRARYAMMIMMVAKSLPLLGGAVVFAAAAYCRGSIRNWFRRADAAFGDVLQSEAEISA